MSLSDRIQLCVQAIDKVAHSAGVSAADRVVALRQIRSRLEQQVSKLQDQVDASRGSNPVSQREGD